MLTTTLTTIFERDLNKLIAELEAYKDEANIWRVGQQIANSAGNLALHIIGNLNHFIGKEIGNTGYVRNRPLEFSEKNISRELLVQGLTDTSKMIKPSLERLSQEDLAKDYPTLVFAEKTSTEFFLLHLTTHLAYHLGQINYHRRLLDAE
jgi:hypothetical protein